MIDILERNKEGKKVDGEFSTIPWPDDKYLRRIGNKRDETKSEADDKPSKEQMHLTGRSWESNKTQTNTPMLRTVTYGVRFNSTAARQWMNVVVRQSIHLLSSTYSSYLM